MGAGGVLLERGGAPRPDGAVSARESAPASRTGWVRVSESGRAGGGEREEEEKTQAAGRRAARSRGAAGGESEGPSEARASASHPAHPERGLVPCAQARAAPLEGGRALSRLLGS